MIAVSQMQEGDASKIDVQQAQRRGMAPAEWFDTVAIKQGPAFTMRNDQGRILMVCGFIESHENCATAWAILAGDIGAAMVGLTREARKLIDAGPWRRLDMLIDPSFAQSVRWASHIGMSFECSKRAAMQDGGDLHIYARIKELSE